MSHARASSSRPLYQNRLSARVRITCRWERQTVGSSARNFLPNLGKTLLKVRKELASCDRRRATGAIRYSVWREQDVFSPAQDRALGQPGPSSYHCCRTPRPQRARGHGIPNQVAWRWRLSPFAFHVWRLRNFRSDSGCGAPNRHSDRTYVRKHCH